MHVDAQAMMTVAALESRVVRRYEKDAPKCRHEHRLKQDPRWRVEQHPDGSFTWTTPSGRQYTTQPTEYPI